MFGRFGFEGPFSSIFAIFGTVKESKFVRTKIVAGYLLLIAVCILSVGYIYRVVVRFSTPDVSYSQLQSKRNAVNITLYHLYQAESYGQLMLAGYQSYEARYRRELQTVRDCIDSLRSLSDQDDSLQTLRLDSITRLIADKERRTVSLRRTIRSGSTAGLLDQNIRDLIGPQASIVADTTPFRHIVYPDTAGSDPWSARPLLRSLNRLFGTPDSLRTASRRAANTTVPAQSVKDTITLVLRALQDSVTSKRLGIYDQAWQEGLRLRYNNDLVNTKIYQLILDFEAEDTAFLMERIRRNEALRRRASHVLGGVSAGSVALMLLFVGILMRDVNRSNRYRRALEQANRDKEALLVAREKLMLAITHDIKAPLGSVMGYIDLLSRLTSDRRQELYLRNMKESSEHLLALVNSLLDFYRLDINKIEVNRVVFHPVQLFETIRAGFAAQAAAKGLELRLVAEPAASEAVRGDAFHIRQIADNLISNALKFTDRGSVTIRVDRVDGCLVFAVRDTGRGISREEKKRIFGEFVRLRSAQGVDGFGLGLSIVDRLVKLLDGTISIESRPGEGSRFIVSVPVAAVSARELAASREEPPAPSSLRPGLRVLLVDDDPLQLEMTAAMCRQAGLVPEACQYPEYVARLVGEGRFDVVLTDIQMPAADGFTVLAAVRRAAPGVKVIAVSAREELGTADPGTGGFDGCLRKPFSGSELVGTIRRACGGGPETCRDGVPPVGTAASGPDRETDSLQAGGDSRTQELSDAPGRPAGGTDGLSPDFTPLTAFAGSDPEAARNILSSFAEQTAANCGAFEKALSDRDVQTIKSLAHKMLPIFAMLKAESLAAVLRRAETSEEPLSDTLCHELQASVATIRMYAAAARRAVADPGTPPGEAPGDDLREHAG